MMARENMSARSDACRMEPRPFDADAGILFGAPWQAQAFSMTVALNEAGHFTWKEWVEVFSRHRAVSQEAGRGDDGDQYFHDWLAALEEITSLRDLASSTDQEAHRIAWEHAAHRTPHGRPIVLEEGDFPRTAER